MLPSVQVTAVPGCVAGPGSVHVDGRGDGVELEGADVNAAGAGKAALVGTGNGDAGDRRAPVVDGRAAGQECDRLRRAAVVWPVRLHGRIEPRVGDADMVVVDEIHQPAGSAGADQVVRAGQARRCRHRAMSSAGALLPVPGIEGDDRVVQGDRAARDIDPSAGAGLGDVVVGDGAVDGRQSAASDVDAAAVPRRDGRVPRRVALTTSAVRDVVTGCRALSMPAPERVGRDCLAIGRCR